MAYVTTNHRAGIAELLRAQVARFRAARERRALYNQTVRELQMLSDRELADLGISRFTIEDLAREHAYGK